MTDRPLCKCHGEAMWWNKDSRYRAGGRWKCAVKGRAYNHGAAHRAAQDRYITTMPSLKYQALMLKERRRAAMDRKAKRNSRKETATYGSLP